MWEGPPRGGRLREVAPVGGVECEAVWAFSQTSAKASLLITRPGLSAVMQEHSQAFTRMGKARRIARSSTGLTARGRGISFQ